jgi:hypothetical protein
MSIYDIVALLVDLPEQKLRRGQIVTVIEEWQPGAFEVEIANTGGIAYATAAIPQEHLVTVYREPRR